MGRPPGTDAEIEAAREERRVIVADLLVNGWNAPKIARHIGVHHTTIYEDIAAVREQWAKNQTRSYDEWVKGELEALDHMESKIAHRIDTGDVNAIQVRLRIMERRAKLVALDQPTRIVIDDGLTAEIRQLAEQVGQIDNPAVREIIGASNS